MNRLLVLAIVSLVLISIASGLDRALPMQPASVVSSTATPIITGASTTPSSITSTNALVSLRVSTKNARTLLLKTSCPDLVHVKIGGSGICGKSRKISNKQIRRQLITINNQNKTNGTITFTFEIIDPPVAISSSTQKTLTVKVTGI